MFGRHPRLPVDLTMGLELEESNDVNIDAYVDDIRAQLNKAYKLASEETSRSGQSHKRNYDRKIQGATVQVRDRVLVKNVSRRGKCKLANQ